MRWRLFVWETPKQGGRQKPIHLAVNRHCHPHDFRKQVAVRFFKIKRFSKPNVFQTSHPKNGGFFYLEKSRDKRRDYFRH
jgi:hypothetical protein